MSIFTHSGYGYSKTICKSATTWFLSKHLSDYEIGNLEITHKGLKRDGSWGYCDPILDGYRIELQSGMKRDLYIRTLIHELIHVKQWVEGRLHYRNGNTMFFMNEYVDKTDYHNQPHEIEAFELEGIIYQNYLEEQYGVTPDEVSFFYSNRLPSRYTKNVNKEVL